MKKILIRPVISEKSMARVSEGVYTFEVDRKAEKLEIAKTIEKLFGVKVDSVRTTVRIGKRKRQFRRREMTRTRTRKYAYIKLADGNKISGFDSLLEIDETQDGN